MGKKKIIGIIVIVSLLAILAYRNIFKKAEDDFVFAEVKIGNVIHEILETGQVKKGEQIKLGFKTSGIIEDIYVEISEEVKQGDVLAKLENSQLNIKLTEAQANLELYEAQFDKLLAGATGEEIQVKQTVVDNAQIALNTAEQTLEDIKAQGEGDLDAAYGDALNVLDDSYIKISNAFNTVDSIERSYFTISDPESIIVRDNKDKIENALDLIEPYLNTAKNTQADQDIDAALVQVKISLNDTADALKAIRDLCESASYENQVSSADKTSLDTHRGYINTALTDVVDSQQTISSTKLDNNVDANTYSAKVDTARGSLKAAQDDLAQLTAPARTEDVNLYQAQVKQAQAQVWLLYSQITDTKLKSPIDGQIAKIEKRIGELVQSASQDGVITILPADPYKIEVDIYEEDVAKMAVNNPVEISLVAFSDEILTGKVFSIDPAEKMIDGVVYYEISISMDSTVEGIKPGMTADLIIRTDFKENVLTLNERAVKSRNGKNIVEILENKVVVEKEIEVGLEGTNNLVEVISGLEQGAQVILP